MKRFSKLFFYLLSFGLARGGLFVAPIVLANLLPSSDYGMLELAHAIASISATVLALGTSAVVPLVLVRKVDAASWSGVLIHQLMVVTVLLVVVMMSWQLTSLPIVWLTAACTAVLMLQALWSVTFKSQGMGEASLTIDAGFWGVLALTAAGSFVLTIPSAQRAVWVSTALFLYLVALAIWTVWKLTQAVRRNEALRYISTVQTGLPLMAVSLLALLATTSGRLGIGLLSSPETTAEYAVLFRATALPVIAHQIVIVARFRQIFEWPASELERQLPVIVGAVTAGVIVFWLFSDVASVFLGPAFASAFTQHRPEGLLILTQCILWSAIALNDLINTRSNLAGSVARASALYFVLTLPMAWWFLSSRSVTLPLFVPVHSAVMAGYFLTQVAVMGFLGIRLRRTWALSFFSFVALSAITQLI